MKKQIKNTLQAAALLTIFTSCDKDLWDFSDKNEGAYVSEESSPISTTLSQDETFTEWVKVLEYSELYSTLNSLYDANASSVKFTAFAPTDAAMQEFYSKKGVSSIDELGKTFAQALVRTMTCAEDSIEFSEKFTSKVNLYQIQSVAGEKLDVTVDENETGYRLNDAVHISYDHIACSNGFIYTADGVVNPLVETVWDKLSAAAPSTIMQQAIQATGYDKQLRTIADTTVVLGRLHYTYYNYTLLNVPDAVFQRAGISNLNDLKTAIAQRDKSSGMSQDQLLKQYVEYHILDAKYSMAELSEMNGDDTIAISSKTLAPNQIYMVTRHYTGDSIPGPEGNVAVYVSYFNQDDIAGQTFDLSSSDVLAKNGYLHNLTSWMPVYEPAQTTVVWDLADYSQVRQAAGINYRPENVESSETKIDLTKLDCYTVDVPNGRGNTNYSELCYVTCKSNLKDCLYHDRVVLNMGYLGSVSMKTPTLVKGKYRVTVNMAYLTEQSIMRTSSGCKGGLIKILVDLPEEFDSATDDETLYNKALVAPYTEITKSLPGVYEGTLYEEISFDETASHTMKFIIMDPAASTSSKVYLQFDTIVFTPIE